MNTLSVLLVLICLPAFPAGIDEDYLQGAWLQDGVNWINAPPDIDPHLQTGEAEILYFGKAQTFSIIYCIVNRVPNVYETISHGDGQVVYQGKWEPQGNDFTVEFRLVSRTLKIKGEVLPGPTQHATIKISEKILRLDRKRFHRTASLDKSAHEVLDGLAQAH